MITSLLFLAIMPIAALSQESNPKNTPLEQLTKRSPLNKRTAVAFSVRTARVIPVSTAAQTIRFDQVLLNMRGGYNPHTGVFVVPVTGVYLFTASIRASNNDHGGWVHLMKDHTAIAYLFDNHRGGDSKQVIVRAKKGEHVYSKLIPSYGLWADKVYGYTTMGGILLIRG